MKSITSKVAFTALALGILVVALFAAATSVYPQTPAPGSIQKNRPVLKKQDLSKKQAKPADPDTCAYFVLTSTFDQQVQAIAGDYVFEDLRKIFGDNIVVVQSSEQIPVGVEKSRIHTVNLKLIQNRLENVPTDSLPKAVARAVLDPLGNIAAGKAEQVSKVPGTGEVARIILRQGKRSTNVDGQDVALRYWWTLNVKVDGLPAKDETFIWIVARHRTDDYKNQYCYNAVGLGSNFTNIEPYDTEDWLGCDDPAIIPGLYNLTVKELWQRPVVKQWLATIPKPPAARSVGQVVAEHEANENCNVQEYDVTLKRYRCVAPKSQTPCLRRRPNTDGTFTCLDQLQGQRAGRTIPVQSNPGCKGDPVCEALGASPISSQPAPPAPKPTPTPAQPPTPPANAPVDNEPQFGHTGRPGFAGFTPTTDVGEGSEAARRALGFFCSGSGDAWFTQQWKPGWAFRVNGPMMTKVIGDFQSQNSLTVNGQLDGPTRQVLDGIWKQNRNLFPDMAQLATKPSPCKVKQ